MPISLYKCDKCRCTYDTHTDASNCEETHLAPLTVKTKIYSLTPYPFSVEISFPNGGKKIYISEDLSD